MFPLVDLTNMTPVEKKGLLLAAGGLLVIFSGWKYYIPKVENHRIIIALLITATGGAILTTGLQRYTGVLPAPA